jgi:hypothetical protein
VGGGELVGREFGEGAGAAVGRVDELDEVGVGGLEDVDDGAALAALETVLRYVPAQPNALMAPVSPGGSRASLAEDVRRGEPWDILAFLIDPASSNLTAMGRAEGVRLGKTR